MNLKTNPMEEFKQLLIDNWKLLLLLILIVVAYAITMSFIAFRMEADIEKRKQEIANNKLKENGTNNHN